VRRGHAVAARSARATRASGASAATAVVSAPWSPQTGNGAQSAVAHAAPRPTAASPESSAEARHQPEADPEQRQREELEGERRVRGCERKRVERRHHERHARVADALHRLAARVPHQAVAVRQVSRVAQRDHGVVPEQEVPLALDHDAGALDVERSPAEEEREQQPESLRTRATRPVPRPRSRAAPAR
jgi:hypothetical protein